MNNRPAPEEFIKLPFSTAIRIVIQDVKDLVAMGISVEMSDWIQLDKNNAICSVCLGAAAIVAYNPEHNISVDIHGIGVDMRSTSILELAKSMGLDVAAADRITEAFNHLRSGDMERATISWLGGEPHHDAFKGVTCLRFIGRIDIEELNYMYTELNRVADELQAIGH